MAPFTAVMTGGTLKLSRNIWTPEIFVPPEQIFQGYNIRVKTGFAHGGVIRLEFWRTCRPLHLHNKTSDTLVDTSLSERGLYQDESHASLSERGLYQDESHASLSEKKAYREDLRCRSRFFVGRNVVPGMRSWTNTKSTLLTARYQDIMSVSEAIISQEDAIISQEYAIISQEDAIISTEDAIISQEDVIISTEEAIISTEEAIISKEEKEDAILDLAIEYAMHRQYQHGLSKDRKRAVRKRASTITVNKGEVFLKRKGRQVKVVTAVADRTRQRSQCLPQ